jgi:hypothetical protein
MGTWTHDLHGDERRQPDHGRQAAVAHNLANANDHRLSRRGAPPAGGAGAVATRCSKGLPTRAFAVDASTHTDFTPGPLIFTGRALDMAVQGPGWIALQARRQRGLHPQRQPSKSMSTACCRPASGIPVQGDGGPISMPPDSQGQHRRRRHDLGGARVRRAEHRQRGRPHQAGESAGSRSGARRGRPVPPARRRHGGPDERERAASGYISKAAT